MHYARANLKRPSFYLPRIPQYITLPHEIQYLRYSRSSLIDVIRAHRADDNHYLVCVQERTSVQTHRYQLT